METGAALGRLREAMKQPEGVQDPEAQGFLHEAEALELDRNFAVDPFAR